MRNLEDMEAWQMVADIQKQVAELPCDEYRFHLFKKLQAQFCIHCGRTQPEQPCQCWNDE